MELLANIDVDDLEKAVAFYTQAFGLRLGRRFGKEAAELLGSTAPIYLLVKGAGTPASRTTSQQRDYGRHWTPVHLDFVVPDVDAAVGQAVAAGAVLEDPVETHKWGRIAHLADPFGHGICLLQFLGRGYDEIASRDR
jgi:predicted enzyme related to lactoylglutathione lyase